MEGHLSALEQVHHDGCHHAVFFWFKRLLDGLNEIIQRGHKRTPNGSFQFFWHRRGNAYQYAVSESDVISRSVRLRGAMRFPSRALGCTTSLRVATLLSSSQAFHCQISLAQSMPSNVNRASRDVAPSLFFLWHRGSDEVGSVSDSVSAHETDCPLWEQMDRHGLGGKLCWRSMLGEAVVNP